MCWTQFQEIVYVRVGLPHLWHHSTEMTDDKKKYIFITNIYSTNIYSQKYFEFSVGWILDMQTFVNVWSWNTIHLVIKLYLFNRGDELYVNDPAGLSSNLSISFHICQKIIAYAIQWSKLFKKTKCFQN